MGVEGQTGGVLLGCRIHGQDEMWTLLGWETLLPKERGVVVRPDHKKFWGSLIGFVIWIGHVDVDVSMFMGILTNTWYLLNSNYYTIRCRLRPFVLLNPQINGMFV